MIFTCYIIFGREIAFFFLLLGEDVVICQLWAKCHDREEVGFEP